MLKIFTSIKGAIDLASIMVGVVVIGIIGGIIGASVFAVIPWSQDNAAKATLASIQTAQSAQVVIKGAGSTYGDLKTLQESDLFKSSLANGSSTLSSDGSLCVMVVGGTGYRSEIKSASGNLFYSDQTGNVKTLTASDAQCLLSATTPVIVNVASPAYATRIASGGENGAVIDFYNLKASTNLRKAQDWEIHIPKASIPASYVTNLNYVNGLPAWAAIKETTSDIIVYNNVKSAQIVAGTSQTITKMSLNYAPPSHGGATTNQLTSVTVSTPGVSTGNLSVTLQNVNEQRYGTWSTDVDVSSFITASGGEGTLALTAGTQGLTVTKKSSTVWTLTATSVTNWGLKGSNSTTAVDEGSNPQTTVTLANVLKYTKTATSLGGAGTYTGTGTNSTTVATLDNVVHTTYYPTQAFTVTASKTAGAKEVVINVKVLRDVLRSGKVVVNNANFTITPVSGDTTGNLYTLKFNSDGSWYPTGANLSLS